MKQTQKLVLTALMIALGVVLSPFSIPLGVVTCFPIQHMLNVLSAVLLGPAYALGMSFCVALLRNVLAMGTIFAFPGSMVGATLAALLYQLAKKQDWGHPLLLAWLGELVGTGIIGAILVWPISALFLQSTVGATAMIIPFLVSSFGGSAIAMVLLLALQRAGVLDHTGQFRRAI